MLSAVCKPPPAQTALMIYPPSSSQRGPAEQHNTLQCQPWTHQRQPPLALVRGPGRRAGCCRAQSARPPAHHEAQRCRRHRRPARWLQRWQGGARGLWAAGAIDAVSAFVWNSQQCCTWQTGPVQLRSQQACCPAYESLLLPAQHDRTAHPATHPARC